MSLVRNHDRQRLGSSSRRSDDIEDLYAPIRRLSTNNLREGIKRKPTLEKRPGELSLRQVAVLALVLHLKQARPKDIAEGIGISHGAVANDLRALQTRDLVVRRDSGWEPA